MKKNLFTVMAGVLALLIFAGCRMMTPPPEIDPNPQSVPEPLRYYGDIELYKEQRVPLAVMITASTAADEISYVDTMKNALNDSDINCVAQGVPFDIQIRMNSIYKVLTPAPQCRLNHVLEISVANADGVKVLPLWQHKTEALKSCTTAADAKALMKPQIDESIREWNKNYFRKEAGRVFKVSVLQFRTSRKLIEFDDTRYEKDISHVLYKLRRLPGVVNVRMIFSDKANRVAAFRVVYRSDIKLYEQMINQK